MIRKLYISDTAAAIDGIRKNCPKSLSEIMVWADETVSGIVCHRAHYEMEKCFTPVRFSDTVWNNIPDEIENSDPEWLYALNRHSILLNLAKAYAFTKNACYRDTFIAMISSYLANTSYSKPHLGTSWRSLETGIRPENWIRSIGLFEDAGHPLPSDLISRMEDSLKDHVRQLTETHNAFHRLSNWGVIQDHGLFIAGLALGDEEAVSLALCRLEEELVNGTLEDGEQWEQSPMYHLEVLHSAIDTVLIARRYGIKLPFRIDECVRKLSVGLYEMTLPGSWIIPTGDSDEMNASDLIYLASYLYGLPFKREKAEENWWDLGKEIAEAGVEERTSSIHLASGNVFLRCEDLTVHMISGLMGSGHGHISPLHVDIAEGKSVIVTDSGRYTYTESAERKELKDAEAHNIFMVDGHFPERAVGSWSYDAIHEKMIAGLSEEGMYKAASGLYFGYLPSGVIERRKVILIEDKAVVVIDEVIGDESIFHSYEAFWHIHPAFVLSDDLAVTGGRSALYISSTALGHRKGSYSYSPVYNVVEKAPMLSFSSSVSGMGSVATVFSIGERADVMKIDACLLDSGHKLTDAEALAISIKRSDGEWIVLSRSREIVAQVDMMKAGFLEGYGRLLVMGRNDRYPSRLM